MSYVVSEHFSNGKKSKFNPCRRIENFKMANGNQLIKSIKIGQLIVDLREILAQLRALSQLRTIEHLHL